MPHQIGTQVYKTRGIECAGDLKSLVSESCTRSVVVFSSFVSEHSQTPNKLIQFRRPIPAVSQTTTEEWAMVCIWADLNTVL